MKMRWKAVLAAVLASALAGGTGPAFSQSSGFYKGKVLNLVIFGSPAGGHTRYTRLVAPYIEKYLGAREVRISNMPGGGGLKGANHLWETKPDGSTIALASIPTLILAPIAGSPGAKFDATKFVFLGRITSEPRVLAVGGKSPIKTIQDVEKLKRPFVYPSQGTDEDFYTMAVLADALGFKLKAVTGYEGNADTALAVIKGDGDGQITSYSQALASIKSGDKRPILTIASQRYPDFPNVPTALEVAPPAKRAGIQAIINTIELHRSLIGPPKMNPQATAALRAAVTAAMKDPALLAEADKKKMDLSAMDGAKEQELVVEIAKSSEHIAPLLKAAVKEIQ